MSRVRKSAKFKSTVVLELLRGESAEELSRKYGITMAELSAWRDEFIENGIQGFKRNPEESKLAKAERRIGQLEMELVLVKKERTGGENKKELVAMLKEERYEKTGEPYPLSMVFRVVGCSSSTWYGKTSARKPEKRGPKPRMTDDEVLVAVKEAIEESPFVSEGYIKIWVRMRRIGRRASKDRVLRIMRENGLLSPYRHEKAAVKVRKHECNGCIERFHRTLRRPTKPSAGSWRTTTTCG